MDITYAALKTKLEALVNAPEEVFSFSQEEGLEVLTQCLNVDSSTRTFLYDLWEYKRRTHHMTLLLNVEGPKLEATMERPQMVALRADLELVRLMCDQCKQREKLKRVLLKNQLL